MELAQDASTDLGRVHSGGYIPSEVQQLTHAWHVHSAAAGWLLLLSVPCYCVPLCTACPVCAVLFVQVCAYVCWLWGIVLDVLLCSYHVDGRACLSLSICSVVLHCHPFMRLPSRQPFAVCDGNLFACFMFDFPGSIMSGSVAWYRPSAADSS
jgi:hypothetical protein